MTEIQNPGDAGGAVDRLPSMPLAPRLPKKCRVCHRAAGSRIQLADGQVNYR